MNFKFSKGDVILFQGDSITDCDRVRSDPNDMGRGYAMLAASWISAMLPERELMFLNRGVGGNRTKDLVARWTQDCIDLHPNWISIMIGINNTWRRYDRNDPVPVEQFEKEYDTILMRAKKETKAKLVLLDPFVLPYPENRKAWRQDLDPKIEVVHKLSRRYEALLIPLDRIMNAAFSAKQPDYWALDGVHPTLAGHGLIAQTWIKYLQQ